LQLVGDKPERNTTLDSYSTQKNERSRLEEILSVCLVKIKATRFETCGLYHFSVG